MKKINILYVDDEENNLNSFMATYRKQYHVLLALDGFEALRIMYQEPVEIIFTDHRMAKMNGLELLEIIKYRFPECMRIVITGYTDMCDRKNAIEKGLVHYYLEKPWKTEEIEMTIQSAIEVYEENHTK